MKSESVRNENHGIVVHTPQIKGLSDDTSVMGSLNNEIQSRIYVIRGVQVMLDRDLAMLYHVETRTFNQAVKRNEERFPENFRFQLTSEEHKVLLSQNVIAKREKGVETRGGHHNRPYAFTEQGIAMLSGVLKSKVAVQVSIRIMNTFVVMRRTLFAMEPVLSRVETVERRLLGLEESQKQMNKDVSQIFDAMRDKKFPPQKVFFDGEFFDAFVQMKRFVRQAKKSLVVIDPYFDDTCLPLIAQKRAGVIVTVVRSAQPHLANKLPVADIIQFNKQFEDSLVVKTTDKFHDRYLIIDSTTLVHVGASLNHLGKRCFAFSILDPAFIPDIMGRIL